jgi:hypothetical protein
MSLSTWISREVKPPAGGAAKGFEPPSQLGDQYAVVLGDRGSNLAASSSWGQCWAAGQ